MAHLINMETDVMDLVFQCGVCKKDFNNPDELEDHLHHDDETEEIGDKGNPDVGITVSKAVDNIVSSDVKGDDKDEINIIQIVARESDYKGTYEKGTEKVLNIVQRKETTEIARNVDDDSERMCSECGKIFDSFKKLQAHWKRHKGAKKDTSVNYHYKDSRDVKETNVKGHHADSGDISLKTKEKTKRSRKSLKLEKSSVGQVQSICIEEKVDGEKKSKLPQRRRKSQTDTKSESDVFEKSKNLTKSVLEGEKQTLPHQSNKKSKSVTDNKTKSKESTSVSSNIDIFKVADLPNIAVNENQPLAFQENITGDLRADIGASKAVEKNKAKIFTDGKDEYEHLSPDSKNNSTRNIDNEILGDEHVRIMTCMKAEGKTHQDKSLHSRKGSESWTDSINPFGGQSDEFLSNDQSVGSSMSKRNPQKSKGKRNKSYVHSITGISGNKQNDQILSDKEKSKASGKKQNDELSSSVNKATKVNDYDKVSEKVENQQKSREREKKYKNATDIDTILNNKTPKQSAGNDEIVESTERDGNQYVLQDCGKRSESSTFMGNLNEDQHDLLTSCIEKATKSRHIAETALKGHQRRRLNSQTNVDISREQEVECVQSDTKEDENPVVIHQADIKWVKQNTGRRKKSHLDAPSDKSKMIDKPTNTVSEKNRNSTFRKKINTQAITDTSNNDGKGENELEFTAPQNKKKEMPTDTLISEEKSDKLSSDIDKVKTPDCVKSHTKYSRKYKSPIKRKTSHPQTEVDNFRETPTYVSQSNIDDSNKELNSFKSVEKEEYNLEAKLGEKQVHSQTDVEASDLSDDVSTSDIDKVTDLDKRKENQANEHKHQKTKINLQQDADISGYEQCERMMLSTTKGSGIDAVSLKAKTQQVPKSLKYEPQLQNTYLPNNNKNEKLVSGTDNNREDKICGKQEKPRSRGRKKKLHNISENTGQEQMEMIPASKDKLNKEGNDTKIHDQADRQGKPEDLKEKPHMRTCTEIAQTGDDLLSPRIHESKETDEGKPDGKEGKYKAHGRKKRLQKNTGNLEYEQPIKLSPANKDTTKEPNIAKIHYTEGNQLVSQSSKNKGQLQTLSNEKQDDVLSDSHIDKEKYVGKMDGKLGNTGKSRDRKMNSNLRNEAEISECEQTDMSAVIEEVNISEIHGKKESHHTLEDVKRKPSQRDIEVLDEKLDEVLSSSFDVVKEAPIGKTNRKEKKLKAQDKNLNSHNSTGLSECEHIDSISATVEVNIESDTTEIPCKELTQHAAESLKKQSHSKTDLELHKVQNDLLLSSKPKGRGRKKKAKFTASTDTSSCEQNKTSSAIRLDKEVENQQTKLGIEQKVHSKAIVDEQNDHLSGIDEAVINTEINKSSGKAENSKKACQRRSKKKLESTTNNGSAESNEVISHLKREPRVHSDNITEPVQNSSKCLHVYNIEKATDTSENLSEKSNSCMSRAKNSLTNPSKGKQVQKLCEKEDVPLSDLELLKLYSIHASIVKLHRVRMHQEIMKINDVCEGGNGSAFVENSSELDDKENTQDVKINTNALKQKGDDMNIGKARNKYQGDIHSSFNGGVEEPKNDEHFQNAAVPEFKRNERMKDRKGSCEGPRVKHRKSKCQIATAETENNDKKQVSWQSMSCSPNDDKENNIKGLSDHALHNDNVTLSKDVSKETANGAVASLPKIDFGKSALDPIEIPQEEIEQTLIACGLGTSSLISVSDQTETDKKSKPVTKSRMSKKSKSPEPSTSIGRSSRRKKTAHKSLPEQNLDDKCQIKESKTNLRSLTKIELALMNNPHSPFGKTSWLKHKFDSETDSDDDWEIDLPIVEYTPVNPSIPVTVNHRSFSTATCSESQVSVNSSVAPPNHPASTINRISDSDLLKKYGIPQSVVVITKRLPSHIDSTFNKVSSKALLKRTNQDEVPVFENKSGREESEAHIPNKKAKLSNESDSVSSETEIRRGRPKMCREKEQLSDESIHLENENTSQAVKRKLVDGNSRKENMAAGSDSASVESLDKIVKKMRRVRPQRVGNKESNRNSDCANSAHDSDYESQVNKSSICVEKKMLESDVSLDIKKVTNTIQNPIPVQDQNNENDQTVCDENKTSCMKKDSLTNVPLDISLSLVDSTKECNNIQKPSVALEGSGLENKRGRRRGKRGGNVSKLTSNVQVCIVQPDIETENNETDNYKSVPENQAKAGQLEVAKMNNTDIFEKETKNIEDGELENDQGSVNNLDSEVSPADQPMIELKRKKGRPKKLNDGKKGLTHASESEHQSSEVNSDADILGLPRKNESDGINRKRGRSKQVKHSIVDNQESLNQSEEEKHVDETNRGGNENRASSNMTDTNPAVTNHKEGENTELSHTDGNDVVELQKTNETNDILDENDDTLLNKQKAGPFLEQSQDRGDANAGRKRRGRACKVKYSAVEEKHSLLNTQDADNYSKSSQVEENKNQIAVDVTEAIDTNTTVHSGKTNKGMAVEKEIKRPDNLFERLLCKSGAEHSTKKSCNEIKLRTCNIRRGRSGNKKSCAVEDNKDILNTLEADQKSELSQEEKHATKANEICEPELSQNNEEYTVEREEVKYKKVDHGEEETTERSNVVMAEVSLAIATNATNTENLEVSHVIEKNDFGKEKEELKMVNNNPGLFNKANADQKNTEEIQIKNKSHNAVENTQGSLDMSEINHQVVAGVNLVDTTNGNETSLEELDQRIEDDIERGKRSTIALGESKQSQLNIADPKLHQSGKHSIADKRGRSKELRQNVIESNQGLWNSSDITNEQNYDLPQINEINTIEKEGDQTREIKSQNLLNETKIDFLQGQPKSKSGGNTGKRKKRRTKKIKCNEQKQGVVTVSDHNAELPLEEENKLGQGDEPQGDNIDEKCLNTLEVSQTNSGEREICVSQEVNSNETEGNESLLNKPETEISKTERPHDERYENSKKRKKGRPKKVKKFVVKDGHVMLKTPASNNSKDKIGTVELAEPNSVCSANEACSEGLPGAYEGDAVESVIAKPKKQNDTIAEDKEDTTNEACQEMIDCSQTDERYLKGEKRRHEKVNSIICEDDRSLMNKEEAEHPSYDSQNERKVNIYKGKRGRPKKVRNIIIQDNTGLKTTAESDNHTKHETETGDVKIVEGYPDTFLKSSVASEDTVAEDACKRSKTMSDHHEQIQNIVKDQNSVFDQESIGQITGRSDNVNADEKCMLGNVLGTVLQHKNQTLADIESCPVQERYAANEIHCDTKRNRKDGRRKKCFQPNENIKMQNESDDNLLSSKVSHNSMSQIHSDETEKTDEIPLMESEQFSISEQQSMDNTNLIPENLASIDSDLNDESGSIKLCDEIHECKMDVVLTKNIEQEKKLESGRGRGRSRRKKKTTRRKYQKHNTNKTSPLFILSSNEAESQIFDKSAEAAITDTTEINDGVNTDMQVSVEKELDIEYSNMEYLQPSNANQSPSPDHVALDGRSEILNSEKCSGKGTPRIQETENSESCSDRNCSQKETLLESQTNRLEVLAPRAVTDDIISHEIHIETELTNVSVDRMNTKFQVQESRKISHELSDGILMRGHVKEGEQQPCSYHSSTSNTTNALEKTAVSEVSESVSSSEDSQSETPRSSTEVDSSSFEPKRADWPNDIVLAFSPLQVNLIKQKRRISSKRKGRKSSKVEHSKAEIENGLKGSCGTLEKDEDSNKKQMTGCKKEDLSVDMLNCEEHTMNYSMAGEFDARKDYSVCQEWNIDQDCKSFGKTYTSERFSQELKTNERVDIELANEEELISSTDFAIDTRTKRNENETDLKLIICRQGKMVKKVDERNDSWVPSEIPAIETISSDEPSQYISTNEINIDNIMHTSIDMSFLEVEPIEQSEEYNGDENFEEIQGSSFSDVGNIHSMEQFDLKTSSKERKKRHASDSALDFKRGQLPVEIQQEEHGDKISPDTDTSILEINHAGQKVPHTKKKKRKDVDISGTDESEYFIEPDRKRKNVITIKRRSDSSPIKETFKHESVTPENENVIENSETDLVNSDIWINQEPDKYSVELKDVNENENVETVDIQRDDAVAREIGNEKFLKEPKRRGHSKEHNLPKTTFSKESEVLSCNIDIKAKETAGNNSLSTTEEYVRNHAQTILDSDISQNSLALCKGHGETVEEDHRMRESDVLPVSGQQFQAEECTGIEGQHIMDSSVFQNDLVSTENTQESMNKNIMFANDSEDTSLKNVSKKQKRRGRSKKQSLLETAFTRNTEVMPMNRGLQGKECTGNDENIRQESDVFKNEVTSLESSCESLKLDDAFGENDETVSLKKKPKKQNRRGRPKKHRSFSNAKVLPVYSKVQAEECTRSANQSFLESEISERDEESIEKKESEEKDNVYANEIKIPNLENTTKIQNSDIPLDNSEVEEYTRNGDRSVQERDMIQKDIVSNANNKDSLKEDICFETEIVNISVENSSKKKKRRGRPKKRNSTKMHLRTEPEMLLGNNEIQTKECSMCDEELNVMGSDSSSFSNNAVSCQNNRNSFKAGLKEAISITNVEHSNIVSRVKLANDTTESHESRSYTNDSSEQNHNTFELDSVVSESTESILLRESDGQCQNQRQISNDQSKTSCLEVRKRKNDETVDEPCGKKNIKRSGKTIAVTDNYADVDLGNDSILGKARGWPKKGKKRKYTQMATITQEKKTNYEEIMQQSQKLRVRIVRLTEADICRHCKNVDNTNTFSKVSVNSLDPEDQVTSQECEADKLGLDNCGDVLSAICESGGNKIEESLNMLDDYLVLTSSKVQESISENDSGSTLLNKLECVKDSERHENKSSDSEKKLCGRKESSVTDMDIDIDQDDIVSEYLEPSIASVSGEETSFNTQEINIGISSDTEEDLAAYCEDGEDLFEGNIVQNDDKGESEHLASDEVDGLEYVRDQSDDIKRVTFKSGKEFSREGSNDPTFPDVSKISNNVNNISYQLQKVCGKLTSERIDSFDIRNQSDKKFDRRRDVTDVLSKIEGTDEGK